MAQISATLTTGTVVELTNGRHTWTADEPVEARGTDTGPNPYELLLGSLAACTCITVALYCRHKGLDLKSISATYNLARIHAKDCEDCDDMTTGFIDKITSQVHMSGDFDEAQQKRLAEVAQRCPVHKTLANGVVFSDNATFN